MTLDFERRLERWLKNELKEHDFADILERFDVDAFFAFKLLYDEGFISDDELDSQMDI